MSFKAPREESNRRPTNDELYLSEIYMKKVGISKPIPYLCDHLISPDQKITVEMWAISIGTVVNFIIVTFR